MTRFGSIGTQYLDNSGNPLIEGKLYVYEPGTTTAKDTYADVEMTIPNTNPVILSAAGRQPNMFFSGTAGMKLTDRDDVQIEPLDPVGESTTEGAFSSWTSGRIYNIPDLVEGSDNNFYISITDGNQDSDPTATPADWTQIRFTRVWNTNETYSAAQIVEGSDGLLYSAITGSNTGNDPVTDATRWKPAATADVPAVIRAAGRTYAYLNF